MQLTAPRVGDAQALADALRDVDAEVTVVATEPTARERTLLSRLPHVTLVEVQAERAYGALAVAAVRASGPQTLWDAGQTLHLAELHPVLSAARDLASLGALLEAVTSPPQPLTRQGIPLLTAAMIVKDEQSALPLCLASLRGAVDAVVVCDTGSSDRTVEIAEAFGATVVHTTWTDDFAAARNVPLAAVTTPWVLSIDADERLVVVDRAALKAALKPRGPAALGVLIKSITEEQAGGFEHEAARLFRREHLHWVGAVHETVQDERTGEPPETVRFSGVQLIHEGYLNTVFLSRDKAARNLALAEKDYADLAGRPRAKAADELARALSMHPDTAERQEELLTEALAAVPADLPRLAASIAVRLSGLLRDQGRTEDAVDAARRAVSLTPSDPAATLELAASLFGCGRPQEALDALDVWEANPVARQNEVIVRNTGHVEVVLPSTRGILLAQLGRTDEAIALLSEVATRHPSVFGHWLTLVQLVRREPDWVERLAATCPVDAPWYLLDVTAGLPDEDRAQLAEALRRRGIDADEHTSEARTTRAVEQILDAHSETDVAAAALALEDEDPVLALKAWEQLPWSSGRQVALARCHLAVGSLDAAFDALDGIDPVELDVGDRLTVAWLAAHAGDLGVVQALLESLPDDLGPWEAQVKDLRALLPGRVGSPA